MMINKQFVMVKMGEEKYCIPIEFVITIMETFSLTPVPNSIPYIDGVVNLKSKVIPVINLKKYFGVNDFLNEAGKILVISIDDKLISFLVDDTLDVFRVEDNQILDLPSILNAKHRRDFSKIINIDESLFLIINPDTMFEDVKNQIFDLIK